MPNPTFSIVSPAGTTLALATAPGSSTPYGLLNESEGLGLAARDVKMGSTVGNGGRVRTVRVPPRPGTLHVLTSGQTPDDLRTNWRRLATAVRSVDGLPMPKLVGSFATGEVYELPFVYESGAETPDRYDDAIMAPLGVIYPDPFWTARDARQFTVRKSDGVGLLPDLAALQLSSSTASGSITITNPGDVPAFPTYRIVGEASSVTASLGDASWTVGPIGPGEVVLVDTAARTVRLADGTNVYDRTGLAGPPKFFPLPAGTTVVSLAIEDASDTASVTGFYKPRIEVIA